MLRRVFKNTMKIGVNKLQANWEGSYAVIKVRDSISYQLETMYGIPPPRLWNIANLKKKKKIIDF